MKNSIQGFILELESQIQNNKQELALGDILTKIQFFQHERLVHFLVTFFVGICCILFLFGFLFFENIGLLLLFLITLCLLMAYLFHYYTLENGVQKLYSLYFEYKKKK